MTPHGFKDATTDPVQIARWWDRCPTGNIGIATGSGLVVLDVDGEKGWNSLKQLTDAHGDLPDTASVATARGKHYYFCTDVPIKSNQGKLGEGLDIRAEGGYVVAPPSIHPSGHAYSWMGDNPVTALPFPLLGLLNAQDREPLEVPEGIPEGQRNGTLFRLASKLRGAGLSEAEILASVRQANLDRCNPPLDDSEVQTICRSAARYEQGDLGEEKQPEQKKKRLSTPVVREALSDLGITVRYNLLLKELDVQGMPESCSRMNAAELLPVLLRDYLQAKKVTYTNINAITDSLKYIADENRFNPVEDYLTAGQWDGSDRLPELYRILGVSDPMELTLIRKWLIQCVALGLNTEEDPIGAEGVLVLQGPQGAAKTAFFRVLAPFPRWFVEGASIDMRDKDSLIRALGGWITELGELDGTLKREQMSLKAFITNTSDSIRAPYGRTAVRAPRRTSFCGTVNPGNYLRDETGARRFWTIHTPCIDKVALFQLPKAFTNQLWYQVYDLYLTNRNGFRLTETELATVLNRNRVHEVPLPYELEIRELLTPDLPVEKWEWWSAAEVKKWLLREQGQARQIGRAMAKIAEELKPTDSPKYKRFVHGSPQYLLPIPRLGDIRVIQGEKEIESITP